MNLRIAAATLAAIMAMAPMAAKKKAPAAAAPAPTAPRECLTYLTFDRSVVDFDNVKRLHASHGTLRAADTISYCPGLRGNALDLTDEVANRIPVTLAKAETPDYTKSFSFSVWVQTKPGARQGTPIIANKKPYRPNFEVHREWRNVGDEDVFPDQSKTPGIVLGTTDLGGWYIHLCDSTIKYSYTPTVERQRINDGRWHNITASVDLDNKEMWLYFDGQNVAVYNMPDLAHAVGPDPTFIGGANEYTERSHHYSRGERAAFNGRIDEVKIWDRAVTPAEVATEYATYFPAVAAEAEQLPLDRVRVMAWNIWHGGGRYGEHVGLARTAEVIKNANPDLVAVVEAYGGGAVLADSLRYNYYLLSDNLAILSRYPIAETIRFYKAQRSGGIMVDLPANRKLAFFDIWLDWHGDTDTIRSADIRAISQGLAPYAANADRVPVIAGGDFNSASHLDDFAYRTYGEKRINNPAISWPSKVMIDELGFTDSFRQLYPQSEIFPGSTWTPQYNGMRRPIPNRVDFIYYKGSSLLPYFSETVAHHGVAWPSDHAAVITDFFLK